MTTYQQILDAAWSDHLAPKSSDAPSVVTLFSGVGGGSLGCSMAGYRELLAVERNNAAVEVFRRNFPDVPVWHGDIHDLSVDEAFNITGLAPGQLDLLLASPPCQGASRAGRRLVDDPRNQLWREAVRLLRGLRPRVLVLENVRGLIEDRIRPIFEEMIAAVRASGYQTKAWIVDMRHFQVPQARRRLILVAVREDLQKDPTIPGPESVPLTVAKAWVDLPSLQVRSVPTGPLARLAPLMRPGEKASRHHPQGHYFNTVRLAWDRPSPTLLHTCKPRWVLLLHPDEDRGISVNEAMRLQSFPDQFVMVGDHSTRWGLIGDSVPPLFMRSLARHLRRKVLENSTPNEK